MTKKEALDLFGGQPGSARKMADALGITEQAISQWDDDCIPELRAFQILVVVSRDGEQAGTSAR